MRILLSASSILCIACLLLTGCESIGIPNHLARHDEVPDDVKAQPLIVQAPPVTAQDDTMPWPRLGDVPFMPKDFSPPPVYNHYMNEMEFQRDEAGAAKDRAVETDPAMNADTVPFGTAKPNAELVPPQLPQIIR